MITNPDIDRMFCRVETLAPNPIQLSVISDEELSLRLEDA